MSKRDVKAQLEALRAELERVKLEKNATTEGGQQFVFAPKLRKVEKFSGKKGQGVSVYEFTEEMTRILKARPTPQEEQVDFVLSHLEGPAREEMRFRPTEEKKSPEAVLEILKEVFGERATVSELLSEFYSTKQSRSQSLQDFSVELMGKLERILRVDKSRVKERDSMLRDQLAENVHEPWLRRELKRIVRTNEMMTFHDLREEAIVLAQDQEEPKKKTEATLYAEKANNHDDDVKELIKTLRNEMSDLRKELSDIKGARSKTVQCYHCKEKGHIKRNCPKKGN
ncbi:zinc finger CCHC domain-containing protein 12-like [Saccostrea echinata]|uniref:zinc finger CCHC domain-containing protein 12-like n=1 Tax=Saccostrea echinata TaxID=191078 RepID=UPI002A832783|nr:zinc finger CCHC domain-containing protein 12-like [Saccostrea echinata]